MIDDCIENSQYVEGIEEVRKETWEYPGERTKRAVDYILQKYQELTKVEEKK